RSTRNAPAPGPLDDPETQLEVVPVPLNLVDGVSSLRIGIPTDLRVPEATRAVLLTLRALCQRYSDGAIPQLDPVADQGIEEPEVLAAVAEEKRLWAELERHPLSGSLAGAAPEAALLKKASLLTQADELRRQMRNSQLLSFEVEAKNRADVLRKLGYVDENGIVTLKGRVACEISTSDELLTTELMLNGTFNRLDPHQLAALISCLIQVERSKEEIRLTHALSEPLLALQTAARQIAEVSVGCLLEVDVDAYVQSFWPYLMDVMYEWSRGASFARVCDMTDIFEGSIVRATRRLDELMQELEAAAEAVGNETMRDKIAASRDTIRRDIMFSASLYI
ncbi:DSHCT domain-containing protein, partial [Helicosporidium sp. ATCC 50920]